MSKMQKPLAYVLGECIARMLCKDTAVAPDTPTTASLYLYGTPSDSGNIGLRSGGDVTYYEGAVLMGVNALYTDEIKAEYPHAHVVQILDLYTNEFKYWQVYFEKKQPYTFYANISADLIEHGFDNELSQLYVFYSNESGTEWFTYNENPREYEHSTKLTNVVWANYDVLNIDDTIYRPASEPIPVSGIVDYDGDIPIYE